MQKECCIIRLAFVFQPPPPLLPQVLPPDPARRSWTVRLHGEAATQVNLQRMIARQGAASDTPQLTRCTYNPPTITHQLTRNPIKTLSLTENFSTPPSSITLKRTYVFVYRLQPRNRKTPTSQNIKVRCNWTYVVGRNLAFIWGDMVRSMPMGGPCRSIRGSLREDASFRTCAVLSIVRQKSSANDNSFLSTYLVVQAYNECIKLPFDQVESAGRCAAGFVACRP